MGQTAYIFDVDGVFNDLRVYEPDERIISHIAHMLDAGTFVAINTGRGYDWVGQNVVQPVREQLGATSSIERFFVAAEMGGLGVEFPGGREERNRSAFSLSAEHAATVRRVFDEHPEYADRIHWYEGKQTMATLDKNTDTTTEDFRPIQKELTEILKNIFHGQHVTVANSNDAIDVHAPEAGKAAGAQLIYDWLRRVTDLAHDQFVCFGDSILDYEMAIFFAGQDRKTTFVYTGPAFGGEHDPRVTFIDTVKPYNEGTVSYLNERNTYGG